MFLTFDSNLKEWLFITSCSFFLQNVYLSSPILRFSDPNCFWGILRSKEEMWNTNLLEIYFDYAIFTVERSNKKSRSHARSPARKTFLFPWYRTNRWMDFHKTLTGCVVLWEKESYWFWVESNLGEGDEKKSFWLYDFSGIGLREKTTFVLNDFFS